MVFCPNAKLNMTGISVYAQCTTATPIGNRTFFEQVVEDIEISSTRRWSPD
jgi:hypothetical protein